MFTRSISKVIDAYKKFPVIALLGPRQAGKTTLTKMLFPHHTFLTLDHEGTRSFALEDPERFLHTHENSSGIILDEFQYAPALTNYIKQRVDQTKRPGYFVLTGSQNFLTNVAITESLAGRVGILNLLPLSLDELEYNSLIPHTSLDKLILQGSYPRIYDENISPQYFYPSYLQSYVERDIRKVVNIGNLSTFQRFLSLCAGRIGNVLNIDALAVETGVSAPTVKQWLSILEASYVVFLLQPYFKNFNKRIIKRPKLYFFDTGLACSLLRLTDTHSIAISPFRGALFESLIIADIYKQYTNKGTRPPLYFWRDKGGAHEIDCIIDKGVATIPIEIKSGATINPSFFKGITYWNKLTGTDPQKSYIIYGGEHTQYRSAGNLIGWKRSATIVEDRTL